MRFKGEHVVVEDEELKKIAPSTATNGFGSNSLPPKNNDGMIATFSAQYKPIPGILLPGSLQDANLARLSGIQSIDGPVPAVLRSRCFGGTNRPRVRGENAQAFLDEFRWKNLHADGYAG